MGRIVIPRLRQQRRQQIRMLPKEQKYGYFSRGFGPQEMQLVSKLADLAVAGGGQIARAVQISNREKEQAEAQAEYDQRLQSEIDSRKEAAKAEVDDARASGQVEAFFAQQGPPSVRERLPSLSSMTYQSDLVQPRPTQPGPFSPGVLAMPGLPAPEDMDSPTIPDMLGIGGRSMLEARSSRPTPEDTRPPLAGITPEDLAQRTRLPGLSAAYQGAMERRDIGTMGRIARQMGQLPGLGSAYPTPAPTPEVVGFGKEDRPVPVSVLNEVPSGVSLPAAPPTMLQPQIFRASPKVQQQIAQEAAQALQQAQQAQQTRDFRQEALEAIGPAPEAKPFRIADILAQASSARTAGQRAMLLQAAADSPDIQAANLSDLAKGDYRDRAMKAVLKLFPKEDREMSELDKARYDQITARTELVDLQRKNLEQKMGDVSKAKSISPVVRRSRGPETGDAFDSATAWTEHYEDKEAKRGQFSDDAIFAELTALAEQRAAQEGRQPTPQEMSFNAADIERGRRERFNRLVGRYSAATPDTILGLVARDMPGKRQKSLRKSVLDMVGKVGDRKKALESAEIKRDNAEAQSRFVEGRQSRVLSQRQEGQQRLEGFKQEGRKSLEGLRQEGRKEQERLEQKGRLERDRLRFKDKQELVGARHKLRLDEIKTRADLSADQAREVENQRAKNRMLLERMRASLRGNTVSAQERIVRNQIVKNKALLETKPDPIMRAYLNSYIEGLEGILKDVQGGRIPTAPPPQSPPLTQQDARDLDEIRRKHGRKQE